MARSRNIKPGFYTNEDLAECSIWARFIFPGLWMLADRDGRLEDRPRRIKGELLPFDPKDIDPLLNELEARNFILRYQNDEGRFIQILKFNQHQSPHYSEKKSVIKPPSLQEYTPHDAPPKPEKRPFIKRGSQPPDSLIPDSLIPESMPVVSATSTGKTADATPSEPDPRTVATVEQLRVTAGVGTDDHAKAGALFAVLKANSCNGTPSDPRILEWVRNGLTPDGLRSVIAKARESTQDVLGPNYLNRVMDSMKAAKGNGKGAAWSTDESACDAKARELGITARPGESYQQLRNRIAAALTRSASESVR